MYRILVLDFGHATFLTGDSGSTDVREIIYEKLPRTVLLFTTATVVISLIGIFAGAASASRPGSPADRATFGLCGDKLQLSGLVGGLLMIFAFRSPTRCSLPAPRRTCRPAIRGTCRRCSTTWPCRSSPSCS